MECACGCGGTKWGGVWIEIEDDTDNLVFYGLDCAQKLGIIRINDNEIFFTDIGMNICNGRIPPIREKVEIITPRRDK